MTASANAGDARGPRVGPSITTAGSAVAIGATRRRRALGLLVANGATPSQLLLAAGAIATVGVLVGASTAIPMVGATRLSRSEMDPGDVLEPRRILTVLAVVVVVPVAAAALRQLRPLPQRERVDARPA